MKRSFIIGFIYLSIVAYALGQPHQKTILTKTEKQVIPEGIAINPADGKIYVSSIALKKIVAIDSTGTQRFYQDGAERIS